MNRECAPKIVYHGMRPAEPLSNSGEQTDCGLRGEGARENGVIRPGQHGFPMPSQRVGQRLPHRDYAPVALCGLHPLPSNPYGPLRKPHVLPCKSERLGNAEPCRGEAAWTREDARAWWMTRSEPDAALVL